MTDQLTPVYGAIEAGGTKFVCAVGSGPGDLHGLVRIATTSPEETLAQVLDYFKSQAGKEHIKAVGIGSFGPLDLDPASPVFGFITATPKPGWSHTDLAGTVRKALGIPVCLDTDVNAAALGEWTWGAAGGLEDFIYLTVGTGIGGGGMVNGRLIHGLTHPEMGHIRLPHDLLSDPFEGSCPFHADCLEGLASGAALQARWGRPAAEIPPDHPAWKLEADYLAGAIADFICTLSPRKVILGGGVMKKAGLLHLVQEGVLRILNNYISSPALTGRIESYIVPPALGDLSGVAGALALAANAGQVDKTRPLNYH